MAGKLGPRMRTSSTRRAARRLGAFASGLLVLVVAVARAQLPAYEKSGGGLATLSLPTGATIEILVETANLGSGEVELAELTFPAGAQSAAHRHGSIEILYVISGRMDHVVNGESHVLEPGMVGIVRPEDTVEHRVLSDEPVRVLAVWAPGGEAARLRSRFERPADR